MMMMIMRACRIFFNGWARQIMGLKTKVPQRGPGMESGDTVGGLGAMSQKPTTGCENTKRFTISTNGQKYFTCL